MTTEQISQLRQIISTSHLKEVAAAINSLRVSVDHEAETKKSHFRKRLLPTPEEWVEYKSIILDGEGVLNHTEMIDSGPSLLDRWQTAVIEDDISTTMTLGDDLLKSLLRQKGSSRTLDGGTSHLHGSNKLPVGLTKI